MILKNERKSGAAMTEVAIGAALAAVALFVALGLFNDNIAEMISNSNLSNVFSGNDSKTLFSQFSRDYSNSQINVQIMGEQGLGMLRRKANNKAITQIGEAFGDKDFGGVDTSVTNANSIGYLAIAIKAIVGKPDICVYMKKDSDKFCDKDKIGGYNYKIDIGGVALTINKVDETGNIIQETKVLNLDGSMSSILSSVPIPIDETTGASNFDTREKYDFIKDLSTDAKPYVYPPVILMREVQTFESTKITVLPPPTDLVSALTTILNNLKQKANDAYTRCHCYHLFGARICVPWQRFLTHPGCGGPTVSNSDNSKVSNWTSELATTLSTSASGGVGSSELINLFKSSLETTSIIDVLNDDKTNSITACETLINGLVDFSNQYNVPLVDLDVIESSGSYTITKGGQTCSTSNEDNSSGTKFSFNF